MCSSASLTNYQIRSKRQAVLEKGVPVRHCFLIYDIRMNVIQDSQAVRSELGVVKSYMAQTTLSADLSVRKVH